VGEVGRKQRHCTVTQSLYIDAPLRPARLYLRYTAPVPLLPHHLGVLHDASPTLKGTAMRARAFLAMQGTVAGANEVCADAAGTTDMRCV
jgi:hypothetical protein